MHFARVILRLVLKLGGVGLFALGVLDSSFLVAPWGNDLLLIAMTAHHPKPAYMAYYALMSTAGSVLGCLLLDLVLRPVGAKGLEKHLSRRRLKYVQHRMEKNAAVALAVASLAPPPFPFTAFVMAAAALQYSRLRLLAVIAITRLIRFLVLGALALRYGERILRWGKNPVVQAIAIGLIVVSVVGSAISVYGWIRRGRAR
jgi:membrane protein YqaA with SNARE-associated domain